MFSNNLYQCFQTIGSFFSVPMAAMASQVGLPETVLHCSYFLFYHISLIVQRFQQRWLWGWELLLTLNKLIAEQDTLKGASFYFLFPWWFVKASLLAEVFLPIKCKTEFLLLVVSLAFNCWAISPALEKNF